MIDHLFLIDLKCGWTIYSADKSFVVYADTERDKRMWVNQINLCLNALSDQSKCILS